MRSWWIDYTHAQELDRIELGEQPARCLKGENGYPSPERERLVAGRAYKAHEPLRLRLRHEAFARQWGTHLPSELVEIHPEPAEVEASIRERREAALFKSLREQGEITDRIRQRLASLQSTD